jgi:hypothetical protein
MNLNMHLSILKTWGLNLSVIMLDYIGNLKDGMTIILLGLTMIFTLYRIRNERKKQ